MGPATAGRPGLPESIGLRVSTGQPPRVGATIEHVFQGFRGYPLHASDTSDLVVVGQPYPEIIAAQLI